MVFQPDNISSRHEAVAEVWLLGCPFSVASLCPLPPHPYRFVRDLLFYCFASSHLTSSTTLRDAAQNLQLALFFAKTSPFAKATADKTADKTVDKLGWRSES